jgi:hypothetical protein
MMPLIISNGIFIGQNHPDKIDRMIIFVHLLKNTEK